MAMCQIPNYNFTVLFAAFFSLFVIGDYLTTTHVVSISPIGLQTEINPVISFIYSVTGQEGFLLLKLVTFGAIAFALYRMIKNPALRRIARYSLVGLAIYSTAVVGINLYTLYVVLAL